MTDADAPEASAVNPGLDAARLAVEGVLHTVTRRYAPNALLLAGFSQGAMLSLDVALAASPAVQRVAVLSGALLLDAAARLEAQTGPRPAVFISHGRDDQRLPFTGGERMKAALESHGFAVTWRPFEGGHRIPEAIVADLSRFLFGS